MHRVLFPTTEYITLTRQQVFISKVTNLFSVKWKTNKNSSIVLIGLRYVREGNKQDAPRTNLHYGDYTQKWRQRQALFW